MLDIISREAKRKLIDTWVNGLTVFFTKNKFLSNITNDGNLFFIYDFYEL